MKQISKQSGMSALGLLIMALVLGFSALCVIKLAPVYMDFWSIKGIIDSVEREPAAKELTKNGIASLIVKRIDVNGIRDFDFADSVTIEKSTEQVSIELDYEVREELVGNIDVVLKFYHIAEYDL
jgi:hypothetical protein